MADPYAIMDAPIAPPGGSPTPIDPYAFMNAPAASALPADSLAATAPPPAATATAPGALDQIGAGLARGTRNVAQGLAVLPGMVSDSLGQLINLGEKGLEGLTGTDLAAYRIHPLAQGIDSLLDAASLPKGAAQPGFIDKLQRSLASVVGGGATGAALEAAAPAGSALAGFGSTLQAAPVQQAAAVTAPDVTSLVTDPALANNPQAKAYVDGIVSLAAAGSMGGLQKWLSAPGLDPVRAALAQRASQIYGIPLAGTDISQSPFMRMLASVSHNMPFGGWGQHDTDLNDALTRAISTTMGENTPRITPPVMQAARTRIGNELDRIGAVTTIDPDAPTPDLWTRLAQVESDAHSVTGATPGQPLPPQAQAVQNQLNDVQNRFAAYNGQLPGSVFQSMIAKNTPLDMVANNPDPGIANFGSQIRDHLFDAWEASAPSDEVQALQNARFQYKNMKTIEPLVEKSATGWISPKLLTGAARSSFDQMAYQGAGPLGELGQIGSQFYGTPPDSGTPFRNLITGLVVRPASAFGTLGLSVPANAMLGGALRSNAVRNAAMSQRQPWLPPGGPTASLPLVSLLGSQAQQ